MKKAFLSSIFLGILTITLFDGKVFAQTPASAGAATGVGTGIEQKAPIALQQNIANLKQRADAEIIRRVTSLTELITKINALKKLSATDKSDLTAKLQTEIDSLNALKIKIDSDTDFPTLKTDVQSIIQSYRIYALFFPEIRILIAADAMSTTAGNLTTLSTKLQTLIAASGATGDTLTSLQSLLADMQAKIKDANDLYQAVKTELLALTPQGYPGNRTTLMDARTKLRTAATDLKAARDDAKQIVKILRSLKKTFKATGSAAFEKETPEVKLLK